MTWPAMIEVIIVCRGGYKKRQNVPFSRDKDVALCQPIAVGGGKPVLRPLSSTLQKIERTNKASVMMQQFDDS